jgi:hydroxymethylpyrimidine pyrophosphatase-like HAD family hydrolase
MPLNETQNSQLQQFFNQSRFAECGGVITDLDGTAIHEFQGRYAIPQSVELGLTSIYELGPPVVLNTLRFPLSVMRTFGKEWYKISNAPIPTVLMNGSQLGFIVQEKEELTYQEIMAFPLTTAEIGNVLAIVVDFVQQGVWDLLVFYYYRDWTKGEIIWTPVFERIDVVANKYKSASSVISGSVTDLEKELSKEDMCMIFLLIDLPQDKLMAYQHTKRSNFFTHTGVDKLYGARCIADHLKFSMEHSIGAGDSEMDTFLKGVGQAVHVGNPYLDYQGLLPPIRLEGSSQLGELLSELAALQKMFIH